MFNAVQAEGLWWGNRVHGDGAIESDDVLTPSAAEKHVVQESVCLLATEIPDVEKVDLFSCLSCSVRILLSFLGCGELLHTGFESFVFGMFFGALVMVSHTSGTFKAWACWRLLSFLIWAML